jgi:hypothetical protein
VKWIGWKNPEDEKRERARAAVDADQGVPPAPAVWQEPVPEVPKEPEPPAFAGDYLRCPPVNSKPVHVPTPVEVFPDRTGFYTVNGQTTFRKDN